MAEALSSDNICIICNHNVSSMKLPCSHLFCKMCISRMESNNDVKCPLCRKPWQDETEQVLVESWSDIDLKKSKFDTEILCPDHNQTVLFWCKDCASLVCKKCVSSTHKRHDFEVIEEAAPEIRSYFEGKLSESKEKLQEEIERTTRETTETKELLLKIRRFKKEIEKLEANLVESIRHLEDSTRKREDYLPKLSEMENHIKEDDNANAGVISKCEEILLKAVMDVTDLDNNKALEDLASSYQDKITEHLAEISHQLMPAVREVSAKVNQLADMCGWYIRNTLDALAAAQAVKKKTPRALDIVYSYKEMTCIAPDALTAIFDNAERDLNVAMLCEDSFYHVKRKGSSEDIDRLSVCLKSQRCKLRSFYGHLDEAGLRKLLLTSLYVIGLAITSPADMKLVSTLREYQNIRWLNIAVSCDISPAQLTPLPDGKYLGIYFYGITAAKLDKLRPIIDTLMTGRRLDRLQFPECGLSFSEARRLSQVFRGLEIGDISIKLTSQWSEDEKNIFVREMKSTVDGVVIGWDVFFRW